MTERSSKRLQTSDLHPNDGVDEEEHGNEQTDVRQGLEGLNEGPQQDSDGVALPQQFDQTSSSEQLQETHVERIDALVKKEGKHSKPNLLQPQTQS